MNYKIVIVESRSMPRKRGGCDGEIGACVERLIHHCTTKST